MAIERDGPRSGGANTWGAVALRCEDWWFMLMKNVVVRWSVAVVCRDGFMAIFCFDLGWDIFCVECIKIGVDSKLLSFFFPLFFLCYSPLYYEFCWIWLLQVVFLLFDWFLFLLGLFFKFCFCLWVFSFLIPNLSKNWKKFWFCWCRSLLFLFKFSHVWFWDIVDNIEEKNRDFDIGY